MANLSDLIKAVRKGDTVYVSELAEELNDNGVDISSALKIARNINRAKQTRGKWQDIVDVLEEYFE